MWGIMQQAAALLLLQSDSSLLAQFSLVRHSKLCCGINKSPFIPKPIIEFLNIEELKVLHMT